MRVCMTYSYPSVRLILLETVILARLNWPICGEINKSTLPRVLHVAVKLIWPL